MSLDDNQIEEIREVFNHFDTDGNQVIDPDEFGRLCEALGAGFTPEELELGLKAIDTNSNGKIEFSEFVAWWENR